MAILLIVLLVIVVAGIIAVAVVAGIYNGLVGSRNTYKNEYAQIDVQLKRRHDLIPNLVETAKGYMAHERGTLEAVIAARAGAVGAGQKAAANPGDPAAMKNVISAESALTGALGKLLAVAEAYPDLKANQNMLALQQELSSTEDKIAYARQAYNDSVQRYNTQREVFPNNIIAGMFNFLPAELFVIDKEEEREAPKVSF